MRNTLKYLSMWDVGILLTCVVFVLIKIPFLNLPYFWDEAWVYAPAVFDMYENGPSLSPDSINPDLSRGHPILFHFFAVCWMTLFGTSFTAVHAFSVFMALLLIWATYALGTALANRQVGFWAAVLLAMQPMFIQQAGFLLPEVQLALFVVLTVLFYVKRNVLLFILSGTAMLLTKETGILVIGMLGIVELVDFARERNFSKQRWLEFLSIGMPVALAFCYFLVQRAQFGWFMFPEHISMFETDPQIWEGKRNVVFKSIFAEQQRPILIMTGLAVAALGWNDGPKPLRILYLLCALTFATMNGLNSWLPDWYYYNVFPALILITLIWTGALLYRSETKNHLFIPFVGLITLVMMLFTSAHFVIGRYLLYLVPLLITSIVLTIHLALRKSKWLFSTVFLSLGLLFYHYTNRADADMTHVGNMKYVDQIVVLQEGIDYLRNEVGFDGRCFAGSFLVQNALTVPVQGYVTEQEKPTCVENHIANEIQFVCLVSFEPDAGLEWVKTDANFEQVFAFTQGVHTSWVYKRIGS
ncbi:MAG: glycosyltransferase family 39 protein [Flavobacteriales bacterium]|nr:glycosyltransferase family 39 protein [Flavobacteriales bacterium]